MNIDRNYCKIFFTERHLSFAGTEKLFEYSWSEPHFRMAQINFRFPLSITVSKYLVRCKNCLDQDTRNFSLNSQVLIPFNWVPLNFLQQLFRKAIMNEIIIHSKPFNHVTQTVLQSVLRKQINFFRSTIFDFRKCLSQFINPKFR